jgi:hypothetical protein
MRPTGNTITARMCTFIRYGATFFPNNDAKLSFSRTKTYDSATKNASTDTITVDLLTMMRESCKMHCAGHATSPADFTIHIEGVTMRVQ